MYFPPQPLSAEILVSAAVSVVFPWSTCPIVPTFTWGLVRSNFALAMTSFLSTGAGCQVPGVGGAGTWHPTPETRHRLSQFAELATGIEPVTSSLPRTRSTD